MVGAYSPQREKDRITRQFEPLLANYLTIRSNKNIHESSYSFHLQENHIYPPIVECYEWLAKRQINKAPPRAISQVGEMHNQ